MNRSSFSDSTASLLVGGVNIGWCVSSVFGVLPSSFETVGLVMFWLLPSTITGKGDYTSRTELAYLGSTNTRLTQISFLFSKTILQAKGALFFVKCPEFLTVNLQKTRARSVPLSKRILFSAYCSFLFLFLTATDYRML